MAGSSSYREIVCLEPATGELWTMCVLAELSEEAFFDGLLDIFRDPRFPERVSWVILSIIECREDSFSNVGKLRREEV